MSTKWRLRKSLQAPFLKEKKGVRFSALYLGKKRNLLIYGHSHQQASCFSHVRTSHQVDQRTLVYIFVIHLFYQKWQQAYAIFEGEKGEGEETPC